LGAGEPIYLSGMSSKARGVVDDDVPSGVQMAPPTRLVQLVFEADRVLTY
jgi:predicted peroxiredoxin